MALERIHLYYLVRVLRVVVPLLVLTFAGALGWQYLENRPAADANQPETRLEANMSDLTEGLVYTQAEDGREEFTVLADRSLGFEGGVNQLEGDVAVTIPGDGETPDRRILGERCGVQQEEGIVDCEGGIEIDLDERTTIRTERITYNNESETATTSSRVQIVRPGEFEVRAERMRALFRDRILDLEGDVQVVRADGSRLGADSLRYDERSGLVEVFGGVDFISEAIAASGRQAEALLLPESTALTEVRLRGSVRVRSLDANDPGLLEAAELDVGVVSGRIERAEARGDVRVDRGAEGEVQSLSGTEVVATLDTEGALELLESTGDAQMTLDTGETIRSDSIRQSLGRVIETGANAVLELRDVRVEGRDFTIEQAGSVRFATDDRASVLLPVGVFRGDRTRASVEPGSGTISSFEQTGSVEFELDGRAGNAESVRVDGIWVEFRGSAKIEDAEFALEAETIRLHRTEDAIEADERVFLVQRAEGEPVFVTSDRLRARGNEAMRFEGDVVLRRGGVQVLARRIDVDPDGRAFEAEGDVVSAMDDMTVRSEFLRFDDARGVAEYSGQVEARTSELDVDSSALEVNLSGQEIERIDARGDVRVRSSEGMYGSGDEAVYNSSEGTVVLSGPGAEASDPASGRCVGDQIVVNIHTHDVRVSRRSDNLAVCVPFSDQEPAAAN